MRIIILGTGAVAITLAENLVNEMVDITVVDSMSEKLHELQEHYDIQTVQGAASHPEVLRRAGAKDCDMLIAVADSDEVNMVACQVAHSLFHIPVLIARIRAAAYLQDPGLFQRDHMPIDVMINPETVVTEQISRLIDHPGASRVLDFAAGKARLVETRAHEEGVLVGHALKDLRQHMPDFEAHIAVIYRKGMAIIPTGDTVIEPDDEISFVTSTANANKILRGLCCAERPCRRILIAGGGNIGERFASNLEQRYSVKLIEPRIERCRQLAESLSKTVVLCGQATDTEFLHEENISATDVFCAVTNDDEINIMSSMLAKRLGAGKTMALVNKTEYVSMFSGGKGVDIVFSPRQTTVSMLLSHIRRGDVVRAHALRRGTAEAIEAVAHGDKNTSKIVGMRIEDIALPEGATFCAIVRNDAIIFVRKGIVIEPDDHMILFLVDKKRIHALEELFQLHGESA